MAAGVDKVALELEPDVDIYTDHFYKKSYADATSTLTKDATVTAVAYNKVFVVGE